MIDVNITGSMVGDCSLLVDPNGRVLQKAGNHEEVLTQVLNLDLVRCGREYGTLGLDLLLKQLRDFGTASGEFPTYREGLEQGEGFHRLGLL